MTDLVYVAFAASTTNSASTIWHRHYRDILKLCRLLGLGLISVRVSGGEPAGVEVHLDPARYQPRKNMAGRAMLLREFQRRVGDPNQGGSSKRPIVTAYRQDALKCAWFLDRGGPTKAIVVKSETGIDRAPRILQRDVYGWFQRADRGTYELTPIGQRALDVYSDVVAAVSP